MDKKFYTETEELIIGSHENYKSYLSVKKKKAKECWESLNKDIKVRRLRIKKLEAILIEQIAARKLYKKEQKDVDIEYSYRKKIVALQKKHGFINVFWDGDDDVYTTWVYSDNCDENNAEDDPFFDSHFHDSYQDAYYACLTYIEHNNKEESA